MEGQSSWIGAWFVVVWVGVAGFVGLSMATRRTPGPFRETSQNSDACKAAAVHALSGLSQLETPRSTLRAPGRRGRYGIWVHGILVAGAPGLDRLPSRHYKQHFTGATDGLVAFSGQFIDGEMAVPSGSVEVVPIEESPAFARVGLVDVASFANRCFVVDLWARDQKDLALTPTIATLEVVQHS